MNKYLQFESQVCSSVWNANQTYRNHFGRRGDESRTVSFLGVDGQINCWRVDDYWKCIRIRDIKQTNRSICLDEVWSDEKGLSATLLPYSLVYYTKGRLFLFWGHLIREWGQCEIFFCLRYTLRMVLNSTGLSISAQGLVFVLINMPVLSM